MDLVLATTWVQIIKAALLLTCVLVLGIWILGRFDFNPSHVLARAAARSGEGDAYLGPGCSSSSRSTASPRAWPLRWARLGCRTS
jgi:cation/acetate symporter